VGLHVLLYGEFTFTFNDNMADGPNCEMIAIRGIVYTVLIYGHGKDMQHFEGIFVHDKLIGSGTRIFICFTFYSENHYSCVSEIWTEDKAKT
jgi:hypothetical protein